MQSGRPQTQARRPTAGGASPSGEPDALSHACSFGQLRAPALPPPVDFRLVGVDGILACLGNAVSRQSFTLLPAPGGALIPAEIGGDFFPRVESVARLRLGGRCALANRFEFIKRLSRL
jgi:hypothetical protein